MPTAYLKKMSEKTGKSLSSLESSWEEAKHQAEHDGHAENYAYITTIFKNMVSAGVEANMNHVTAAVSVADMIANVAGLLSRLLPNAKLTSHTPNAFTYTFDTGAHKDWLRKINAALASNGLRLTKTKSESSGVGVVIVTQTFYRAKDDATAYASYREGNGVAHVSFMVAVV